MFSIGYNIQKNIVIKMGKELFQDPFSTPPQPEEAILKLLEADNDNPFTLGSTKEFISRLTFFMSFVIGFVYLFRNELPSLGVAVLIVVSFLLITSGLYFLFHWFNNLMVKKGLKAIYLCMFILLLIAII
jgi:hypothetical protein